MSTPRTGAPRRDDVPPETIARLNAGEIETANLMEGLVIDFGTLLRAAVPGLPDEAYDLVDSSKARGITRRMETVGAILFEHLGLDRLREIAGHRSDTVRGWACYVIGHAPKLKLKARLELVRPLADDPHFGVREWAWLPLRPHFAKNVGHAIDELKSWVKEPSPYLRRFAVESTRPRGVWSCHLEQLKNNPALGQPLLEPLKAETDPYVQDSVGNWLNDACKSKPGWVRELCDRWLAESTRPATQRICQRALRSQKVR